MLKLADQKRSDFYTDFTMILCYPKLYVSAWLSYDANIYMLAPTGSKDDYAKDGRPREVSLLYNFYGSFYHEPLRAWSETNLNKFALSNHTALKIKFTRF